jgi:glycosyltransferase involved in cell wall biosynthesis
MKILLVSSYLPYPLYSGGQVRLYNLLKELSLRHTITLICEKRENQTIADVKEVEKVCSKVITVKRRKQWSLQNILRTAFSSHSFLVTGHTNEELKSKIKEELENSQYDLVHIETFYVAQNLPPTSLPIILAEHNIEYQVYSRFAQKTNFLLRPLLSIDINKIKKEEEYYWKKSSKLVCVSEEDKNIMQNKNHNPTIVPNGVDPLRFSFKNIKKSITQKHKKILFIGDFKWLQNRDTLSWIINDIWSKILLCHSREGGNPDPSTLKLWIVGRNIPDSFIKFNDKNIIFDKKSSTLPTEQIFQEAFALLAPIRVGGGTSYKILESLSVGTPVIITPLSAKSLQLTDQQDALVGETAKELAGKLTLLLQDNSLYEKISKSGRQLIEKKYSWKNIAKKLEKVYKEV